ncbi:cupin domain-containing protein [Sphingomonas koreensis]
MDIPQIANLFAPMPSTAAGEVFTGLLARPGVRIERIVSGGQATPEDKPFVQDVDEWVVVLAGSAAIRMEGHVEAALKSGDHLLIPGGTRHWVTRTDPDMPTVWLAVHLG